MRRAWVIPAVVAILAWRAPAARADCDSHVLIVPDGSQHTGELSNATPTRAFRFVGKAGRSYAVMVENLSSPSQQDELGVGAATNGCNGPLMVVNDVLDFQEPVSSSLTNPPATGVGAPRIAIKFGADGEAFFSVQRFNMNGTGQFRIRVEETTQFASLWSTSSGSTTYFRLFNTTNRACSVTLDLRTDANATPVGGTPLVTFSLPANTSVTRSTSADLHLHNGQVGHATLSHDCTPGAVQADAWMVGHGNEYTALGFRPARQQR